MDTLISFLAIFGLQFLITQSEGPFGLIAKMRSLLFRLGPLGPFFYKLFECPFCSGCWAGAAIYMIGQEPYKLASFVLWVLAGGAVCLVADGVVSKLHQQ